MGEEQQHPQAATNPSESWGFAVNIHVPKLLGAGRSERKESFICQTMAQRPLMQWKGHRYNLSEVLRPATSVVFVLVLDCSAVKGARGALKKGHNLHPCKTGGKSTSEMAFCFSHVLLPALVPPHCDPCTGTGSHHTESPP